MWRYSLPIAHDQSPVIVPQIRHFTFGQIPFRREISGDQFDDRKSAVFKFRTWMYRKLGNQAVSAPPHSPRQIEPLEQPNKETI